MNLDQAIAMTRWKERKPESFTKKRKVDALTLAKDRVLLAAEEGRDFDGYTVDEVATLLFASRTFTLMEIPLNKLASPGASISNSLVKRIMAEGIKSQPIVVDVNVNKVGKSAKTGYYPPVIVVDGKERFEAASNNAEENIIAWVGNLAAQRMTIHADHQVSSGELQSLLMDAIGKDLGLNRGGQNRGDSPSPGIYIPSDMIYPLENYCIYKFKNQAFKQKYLPDVDTRTITLVGPPKMVAQKWVDQPDVKASTAMESAIQACGLNANCGCGVNATFKKKQSMKGKYVNDLENEGEGDDAVVVKKKKLKAKRRG